MATDRANVVHTIAIRDFEVEIVLNALLDASEDFAYRAAILRANNTDPSAGQGLDGLARMVSDLRSDVARQAGFEID